MLSGVIRASDKAEKKSWVERQARNQVLWLGENIHF